MKINKLILDNFGIYHGKNIFNLKTTKDNNIILIGGKNGNGKTTFFQAIKLCLYGQKSFDKTITKKLYEKHLLNKIHNNPNLDIKSKHTSIELEFEQVINNELKKYNVIRSWKIIENNFEEYFSVYENEKKLDDLDDENWQDFINNLIPKGLSELYFFDGEKIQNLVDDKNDNKEFENSFKNLLGLENVERLYSDLDIFLNKKLNNIATGEIKQRLYAKERELIQKDHDIEINIQEISKLNSNLDVCIKDIEVNEEKIKSEGGKFSQQRDKIKDRVTQLEIELKLIEENFRIKCNKTLPFYFSKNILNELSKRINKEEEYKNNLIFNEMISTKLNKIENKVDKKTIDLIKSEFKIDLKPIEIIHNISENEKIKILSTIDEINNSDTKYLKDFNKEHRKISRELELREKELNYAANDDIIKPYVEKVNALNQKVGELINKIEVKEEQIRKLTFEKTLIENEINRIRDEVKKDENSKLTVERIERIQKVLLEYYNILKKEKLMEFKKEFIKKFNSISRKKDAYESIEIDSDTFNIHLIKIDGTKISKSRLSEGEKQMYALTVLWTLTSLSKREFPFIIDTPMGRLDHSHRKTLIETFFPKISEQLIILSTDSEIDKNYYEDLKKHTAKEYLLLENNGSTKLTEGYFF